MRSNARKVQLIVATCIAALILGSTSLANAVPNPSPPRLLWATNSTTPGKYFTQQPPVFTAPTYIFFGGDTSRVVSVSYSVDGAPAVVTNKRPFVLGGKPLPVSALRAGTHTVDATLTFVSGAKSKASARFATRATVAPPIQEVPATPVSATPPVVGNWNLAFRDEFNGSAVDWTKWADNSPALRDQGKGNLANNQLEWNQRQNCTVANGVLSMTAKKETVGNYQWTSCLITSTPSFDFQYGYVEERSQLPSAPGFWPSFWTWNSGQGVGDREIDIMEFWSRNHNEVHIGYQQGQGCDTWKPMFDPTAGFHTWGVNVTPTGSTFYVDGKKACSVTQTLDGKVNLISNNYVANDPAPTAPSGVKKVDYIRAWVPAS